MKKLGKRNYLLLLGEKLDDDGEGREWIKRVQVQETANCFFLVEKTYLGRG